MKTAVEWLETTAREREKNNPNESAYWHLKQLQKDFEQAKEMEKEGHKQTWLDSTAQFDNAAEMTYKKDFEKYYNETFKQQEQ